MATSNEVTKLAKTALTGVTNATIGGALGYKPEETELTNKDELSRKLAEKVEEENKDLLDSSTEKMVRVCKDLGARLPKVEDKEQIRTVLWKSLLKQTAKAANTQTPRTVLQGEEIVVKKEKAIPERREWIEPERNKGEGEVKRVQPSPQEDEMRVAELSSIPAPEVFMENPADDKKSFVPWFNDFKEYLVLTDWDTKPFSKKILVRNE